MDHSDHRLDYFPCKKNLIFVSLLLLSLLGCATTAKQTEELLNSNSHGLFPKQHRISGVPFVSQTEGHCGPATLAMLFQWNKLEASLESVSSQVYTPGSQGSFQADMISAARRNKLMAVPIEGLPSLLTEVSQGNPVIVFENLSVSWLPQWHYAVVFGYDLNAPEVFMHSGPEMNKRWDLRKFERSWMLAEYWGLVVLPPGGLARSAGELGNLTSAAALEQLGHLDEALLSYKKIEEQWPNSQGALIGMGNVAYQKKNYKESVQYLKQAVKAHPNSSAAKNNLLIAEKALADSNPNTRRK